MALSRTVRIGIFVLAGLVLAAEWAHAGSPQVLSVTANCNQTRVCSFDVTVQHADQGWNHYANRWEVRTPQGTVIATRVLSHPHVDEQPFTRSLDHVAIPEGVTEVHVFVNDSVHGMSKSPYVVPLK